MNTLFTEFDFDTNNLTSKKLLQENSQNSMSRNSIMKGILEKANKICCENSQLADYERDIDMKKK